MPNEFLNQWKSIERHGSKLPHWQQEDCMQFITFRLKDSLPQRKLKEWQAARNIWIRLHPEPWSFDEQMEYNLRFTKQFESWLDKGHGACLFKNISLRKILQEVLMYAQGQKVEHVAWVIMPNHVHLLCRPRHPIGQLIKAWKGVSARRIGCGSIWQANYRDTLIRNEKHFEAVVKYIRRNPKQLPTGTYTHWENERARAIV